MHWTNYLPPTLQIEVVYWVMGSCIAVRRMAATIPAPYKTPWLMQLLVAVSGIAIALCLFPPTVAKVYAIATGSMSAAIACQFYDIIFAYIENKIRAFFGTPPPQEPVEPTPKTKIENP